MQYATLTLSELKVLAAQNNAIPTGDKRSKQSWIDALELAASLETIIEDAWVAPEMPSHAEQEAISYAVDIWADTESALTQTSELPAEMLQPVQAIEKVLNHKPDTTKKPAATIVFTLLCAIAIIIRSAFTIAAAAIRACIHLRNMFGKYNPDYDLWYQLTQRLTAPIEQPDRPAYQ
jgi:hypothetical protein